ncbi:MAG TPA: AAA family ATPase [Nonomuraea sp.]|nr:AAA family ATPase [Nonomuraea sp.]
MLYGRDEEISVIDRLLAQVRGGGSGSLVVRGEPGIGKTALLEYAAENAEGCQVIRRIGIEAESDLPFAGLHLLLRNVLDRMDRLPRPQRRALEGAIGLAPAEEADRLLVGLAVLSLLAEVAENGPVLCLIDDAQWLDRPSLDALTFAARRLDTEGIVLIMATRDERPPGLPELRLKGLSVTAATALLQSVRLAPALRYRVMAEAQGNPLALIELPAALRDDVYRPGSLPLSDRLRAAFLGQVDHLPEATRILLLIAAAAGGLDEVLAAGQGFDATVADLQPAEKGGLIVVDERAVTFRHPLIREAVYQRAPLSLRLAVHQALAAVLTGEESADRRAWHLAAATIGANEEVATELERTALRAADRHGHAAAATAYERAAELSADTRAKARRLTLAAEEAIEAGELDRGLALAENAGRQVTDLPLLTRLAYAQATAHFWRGAYGEAHRQMLVAVDLIQESDPAQATHLLAQALQTAYYVGEPELIDMRGRLRAIDLSPGEPIAEFVRVAYVVVARLLGGDVPDFQPFGEVVTQARRALASWRRELVLVCGAPLIVGADGYTLEAADRLVAECRAQGSIGVLPMLLFFRAQAELLHAGRQRDALTSASTGLGIAEDTGQHQWVAQLKSFLAYLAALEDDEERCLRLGAEALSGAAAPMEGSMWVDWARATLDLGHGRADAAMTKLEALTRGPGWYHISAMRCVPDLVEAAVRCGEPERARRPFDRFADWARRSGQPQPLALAERCLALLGTGGEVEEHYLAALKPGGPPFQQARTALLYGEWLRRSRRRSNAAGQLRVALETFERLGARPWADRARAELEAAGTKAPRATSRGILTELTPQEVQIVRLAAQGLSNKDIAAQLFLSPRTVGYHLYKAYPKLGIASRGDLAALDLTDSA